MRGVSHLGLSAAALDSSWARERQRRQFRNRNKINGFSTGASAFVNSLASGLQGVAVSQTIPGGIVLTDTKSQCARYEDETNSRRRI